MGKLLKVNRKIFPATLAVATTLVTGFSSLFPHVVSAQSNPGLTVFSGVDRQDILNYHLDFGGRAGNWDRYRLRVPGKKITEGVAKFFISYPDYFTGTFDTKAIEVRVRGQNLPIRDIIWDQESRIIEIDLEEPLLQSNMVELVFSNVQNPRSGGTFYFQGQFLTAGQIPVRLNIGTWIVSIN